MNPSITRNQQSPQTIASDQIKRIDDGTVKFIAAGEKINDIETAIRELVENSIDAGATNIEIRLSRFGIDGIEVEDNGSGINGENFHRLAVRYNTSKIADYSKLQDCLETFGFRGEALSCLCNIANLTIVTKAKSSKGSGYKITFKKDGTLNRIDPTGRDYGTTVTIKNLFHSLPVRRRELETTAKRQYDKVVKLIYEHVLARPHIKFSLCKKNLTKKDKDFAHGGTTLEGCIITIFGIKVLESLIPIKQAGINTIASDEKPEAFEDIKRIKIEKRQTRASMTQNLDTNTNNEYSVASQQQDEPVAAKRFKESKPLASSSALREDFFKRSCYSKFARERPEYTIHGYISKVNCGRNSTDCQFLYVNKKPCDIPKVARLINEVYRNTSSTGYPFYCIFIHVQNWVADFNVPRKRAVILQEESRLCNIIRESLEEMYSSSAPGSQKFCHSVQIPIVPMMVQSKLTNNSKTDDNEVNGRKSPPPQLPLQPIEKSPPNLTRPNHELATDPPDLEASEKPIEPNDNASPKSRPPCEPVVETPVVPMVTTLESPMAESTNNHMDINKKPSPPKLLPKEPREQPLIVSAAELYLDPPDLEVHKKPEEPSESEVNCFFAQENVKEDGKVRVLLKHPDELKLALRRERNQRKVPKDSTEFSFTIHPNFNTAAEQELKLNLNKSSFNDMRVLGQFNRGFIITRLNKHLFIIDQHATDERANYEEQLDNNPLIKQHMVRPKPLYMNLIQENVIINNLKAFEDRGFEFKIDKSLLAGFRVTMTATSICKGQGMDEHLTKEDIEELIDVIVDSPNRLSSYTLSKVKKVAASRACRKSVMIGDKLTWNKMLDIVSKMSTLKNPWVCAHNRPTIRHLMDVDWMK